MAEVILEIKHMHKAFGSTIALKDVNITLCKGEIRGLVGENGSGKSTIMSIASGKQSATSGEMYYKGENWAPMSMLDAQRNGIAMILQEANTIPGVTVAQNIYAGQEAMFSHFGIVNQKKMNVAANCLLQKYGIEHIKAGDLIDYYSFEDRKLIEIIRCLMHEDVEILVVDETTTALSLEGREILYKLMHKMAEEDNKSVVFVSHDMDEILQHCSVLTVLRDGDIVGELNRKEMNQLSASRAIGYMMVGREIGEKYYREDYDTSHSNEVALELKNVSYKNIHDFSLTLHKGEILGFGGLSGCGMHEIGRIAYGIDKLDAGEVIQDGKAIKTPLQAINCGIGYISKNRDLEALVQEATIEENIVLPSLPKLEKRGVVSKKKEHMLADFEIDAFRIKCHGRGQLVSTLSGGNKQKVSFAKWTAKKSEVIIMDCPTRGVDIGVKQSMYALIEQMKKEGKAILMISEELSELVGMADRIVIMKDFQITKEFERSPELLQTDIIEYMI
jgi:ribose transport system ATP-binding protein